MDNIPHIFCAAVSEAIIFESLDILKREKIMCLKGDAGPKHFGVPQASERRIYVE